MEEHDGIPITKLIKDAAQSWISGINTVRICQDLKSHGTQVVESIVDLSEGAFDIRKWKRCEVLKVLLVFGANF
jgi:hypothetical protein